VSEPKIMGNDFAAFLANLPYTPPSELETARWEAEKKAAAAEEERGRLADRERVWRTVVPAEYAHLTESHPDLMQYTRPLSPGGGIADRTRLVRYVSTYDKGSVVFVGPAGTGKTMLAVASLRAAFDLRKRCMYVNAVRLAVARSHHRMGDGESEMVEDAIRADVLLIDDLGQDAHTALSPIKDVILLRREAKKHTWFTLAKPRAVIEAEYGGGVSRRMFDNGLTVECVSRSVDLKAVPR
jgi:IstB-like ATP binding protein